MKELVSWLNEALDDDALPIPVIAAVAHCQFATIHPYFDGNGRTARLLTNLILHRYDYGLKGIYSLEEYYAKNLGAYYAAISIGEHNCGIRGEKLKESRHEHLPHPRTPGIRRQESRERPLQVGQ